MTTSTLYHTQGVRGFHYKKTERKGRTEFYHIVGAANQLPCPCCGSKNTTVVNTAEQRRVHGVPIGLKKRFWLFRSGVCAAMTAVLVRGNVWTFAPVLPDAEIVYEHFHVIKLMNERMDALRRKTMNKLEDEQKKQLKGKRYLFLRNQENLKPEAVEELKKLRLEYQDLGTASLMKEYLRNIYKLDDGAQTARAAFELWCQKAQAYAIQCLKQIAKTIRKRIDGLIACWKHDRITNASQEGFNNKIGWLTRQAYGYRDEQFLHLKIYDLPNLSTRKSL